MLAEKGFGLKEITTNIANMKNSYIVLCFDVLGCYDLLSQLQLTIHAYE